VNHAINRQQASKMNFFPEDGGVYSSERSMNIGRGKGRYIYFSSYVTLPGMWFVPFFQTKIFSLLDISDLSIEMIRNATIYSVVNPCYFQLLQNP
jgi:hypothetical protein